MLWLNLINDNDVRKAYISTIYEKHGKQIWYYLKSIMVSRDEDDIYSCCNDVFMVAYQKYDIIKIMEQLSLG